MATVEELRAHLLGRTPSVTRDRLLHLFEEHRRDSSKAKAELGVTFRPIEDTLRDTVKWFTDTSEARAA